MDLAPIVLFVYNRPWHTRQTVEALKKNNLAKDSNLFIFSDGPKNEEDIRDIEKVREYIKTIDGFKNTNIIEREKNYGLANSIINGITEIVNRYGKIIVLEDDCIPSDDFIAFMEKCFDKYENNEKVMNVTGYSLPITIPDNYSYDIYFSYRSSSWGWGTWRRAWKYFDRNKSILAEIEKSSNLRKKINRAGEDLIPMLKNQIEGKLDSWAVFWSINIIKNDGICINPIKSKIQNIGHDGTGTHCVTNDRYILKIVKEDINSLNFPEEIMMDGKIMERYKKHFNPSLKDKTRGIILKMLKLIGLHDSIKKIKG